MAQQLVLQVNVDVVFAVNFLADVAWLLTAGVLAGVRPRLWRVALGAVAGSAAAVWIWFPSGRWLTSVPGLVLGTA
ncbi:MAG: Sporulation factor SpoIIGA, partial [Firmicutes bacterium]|nr:Sporulation factor SpoIIGA [Bacillota bacterium]